MHFISAPHRTRGLQVRGWGRLFQILDWYGSCEGWNVLGMLRRYIWFPFFAAAIGAFLCVLVGSSACATEESAEATDAASGIETSAGHEEETDGHVAGGRRDDESTDRRDGKDGASHGGHSGHEDLGQGNAGSMLEDPFEFKGDLAIYTFVVFLLLLAILGKFAWPPIAKALEEREQNIAGHIAAAEDKHVEAEALLAQHEKKLAGAADEVRELLEEARRDAEHTKGHIIAEARAAAQAEHERGMRDLKVATDTAMKHLAETSANLAVELAGKVVQEKITPQHQARVVREALSKLATSEPSAN